MNLDEYREIYLMRDKRRILFNDEQKYYSNLSHIKYVDNPIVLFSKITYNDKVYFSYIDTDTDISLLNENDYLRNIHYEAQFKNILLLKLKGYRFYLHNDLAFNLFPYENRFLTNKSLIGLYEF